MMVYVMFMGAFKLGLSEPWDSSGRCFPGSLPMPSAEDLKRGDCFRTSASSNDDRWVVIYLSIVWRYVHNIRCFLVFSDSKTEIFPKYSWSSFNWASSYKGVLLCAGDWWTTSTQKPRNMTADNVSLVLWWPKDCSWWETQNKNISPELVFSITAPKWFLGTYYIHTNPTVL